jgi:hypothetical protein
MLVWAKVIEANAPVHQVQYLVCQYCDANKQIAECRAINYLELGSALALGGDALLNITALELGLGTGGYAFVVPFVGGELGASSDVGTQNDVLSKDVLAHAGEQCSPLQRACNVSPFVGASIARPVVCERLQPTRANTGRPYEGQTTQGSLRHGCGNGHIVKLRYTPLQTAVLAAEEPDSPYHERLATASDLKGLPVVCCELHSQMPLVAAGVRSTLPDAKIAYVHTDQAALALAFSELAAQAKATGLIDTTITCGQAFGGELEAVNLHSALCVCQEVCAADVAIVAPGPGIVGTATALGHAGVAQGEALNAAGALGGVPIAALRISFADKRERHRGLSHHTICALDKIALVEAVLPMPATGLSAGQKQHIDQQLEQTNILERHGMVAVDYDPDVINQRGITVKTMGRTQKDDCAFFAAAYAAGVLAGRLPEQRL